MSRPKTKRDTMMDSGMARDISRKLFRIMYLKQKLESVKPLYEEIDRLTMELVSAKKLPKALVLGKDYVAVELVDNFAEKNTVFRPAGVKRFEIKFKRGVK